ncbi:hypothetical protein [Georgenia thermotolerans]|uniref:Uncharacterized protein n=1 Tax=Georgenia thermotolerans TaxID=527326 RepID=A0A7J5UJ49_9MICO|nr:hypothetical protein [Georgenia thermotolerans]KAE8762409.1 hypothetical protein GB883_19500 [Georgenia thermotolerans]
MAEQWTQRDRALWLTCEMALAGARGRPVRPPTPVPSPVRPQLADAETLLAAGPFTRYVLRAGDGSYRRSSGFFFATGAVGLAATAAVAAGQLVGNARRKRAAERDAAPRWEAAGTGLLTVSTHGFYLSAPGGLAAWPYAAVGACEVGRPGLVDLSGQSTTGPVRWLLESDWAELLFAMWALAAHPGHPPLASGAWLPPGWVERAVSLRAGDDGVARGLPGIP